MLRFLRIAGLIFFGVLLGLALGEGLLRLYFAVVPPPRNAPFIADRVLGYRLPPDPQEVFKKNPDGYINNLGFRDRDHTREKAARRYRILGIGDSFVYANVELLSENFLKVAEASLSEKLTSDSLSVEMILMGLGGYSPENEVGLLRSVGLDLNPDLVVLNFFVGNDVTGIPVRMKILGGQRYFVGSPYPVLHFLRHFDVFLIAETVLLPRFRAAMLRIYLHSWVKGRRSRANTAAPRPAQAHAKPPWSDWYLHTELKTMPVFRRPLDRRTSKLWEEAEGYLDEFDTLCRNAGVPWILLVIPADLQVDPELRQVILDSFSLSPNDYDFDAPQRRLRDFAATHKIPIVDPLAEMRLRHSPDDRLYHVDDTHWNARGNRIAGEILAAFIRERL